MSTMLVAINKLNVCLFIVVVLRGSSPIVQSGLQWVGAAAGAAARLIRCVEVSFIARMLIN